MKARGHRRPERLAAGTVGALLALAVALAGCDSEPRPAPSATALPSGISATLLPSAVSAQALVRIKNTTDESLSIGSLRLLDARFAWAGRTKSPRDRTVPASTTALVPVTLPDARCSAAKGEGTRLRVEYALGASIAVASAVIADPSGVVTSLLTAECGD